MRTHKQTSNTPEMSDLPDNIAVRQFRQVSIEETTRYIMKTPSKSCELDLIPTYLLKEVIHELSPILMDLKTHHCNRVLFQWNSKSSSLTTTQKTHTGLHDQKELQTGL